MRLALATLLPLLVAACGSSPECPGLGVPAGVAQGAARLRIEVYDASAASCSAGRFSLHGTDSPLLFLFSSARGRLAIDLPPGTRVVRLRAYADAGETRLIGEGCDTTTVSAGGASCLDLAVVPVDVADAAATGDGGSPLGPDMRGACDHFDGQSAFADCVTDYSHTSLGAQNMCERAYMPAPDKPDCFSMKCSGGGTGSAWCTKSGGASCRCWGSEGAGVVGHVREVTMNGSCLCPGSADPVWY